MIITDTSYPINTEEVALSKLTIEYVQELDCCQSEKDYPEGQVLTVTTDDGGGGKFIRFNTGESGWSICDIEDIVKILSDFKQRFKCES